MRFGIQLFGAGKFFAADPDAFLTRMAAAGYRYLEPCVSLAPIPPLAASVWTDETLALYTPLLRQHGFAISSCHIFTPDPLRDAPLFAALGKKYDIPAFVLPCPAVTEDNLTDTAWRLTRTAQWLEREGITLMVHNDGKVSVPDENGLCLYEKLVNACGPEVGFQPDVGWLLAGGTDPEAFLWRNKMRVRSLHYKDMRQVDGKFCEAPLGTGLLDVKACFGFARAREIIQLADADSSPDFLGDLTSFGKTLRSLTGYRDRTTSTLAIIDTETGVLKPVHDFDHVIEAPNWHQQDADKLYYNDGGRIWRYSLSEDTVTPVDTGKCVFCNNDHVLSPDGREIAVSCFDESHTSRIYRISLETGAVRLVTENTVGHSWLHGWSPDGKEMCYCAFRGEGEDFAVDICSIPADGGEETRLTDSVGYNDGSEYAPDGSIWYNTTRAGLMQVWHMERDGSNPTQMTFSHRNNWFGHVSPDGRKVLVLSFSADGLDPREHLPNMPVELRLIAPDGSGERVLTHFFGGQGSVNVNSWSPDSRHIACVVYQYHHA